MNIEEIKRKLLEKMPRFADAINGATFIEKKDIPTVCTNGKDIFYNPEFIMSINENQRLAAFANSVCHIASNDVERSKDKDQTLWNVATDAIINKFLRQDGFELVSNAVNIPVGENETEEEIYARLLKEKEELGRLLRENPDHPKGM